MPVIIEIRRRENPGKSGKTQFGASVNKYWINYNWYWVELARRRPQIRAKVVRFKGVDTPIGFTAFGQHYEDRMLTKAKAVAYELYHIVIDASFQGYRIGKAATILTLKELALLNSCKEILVACHPDNKQATGMYRSLGFSEIGKNYDDDPLYSIPASAVADFVTDIGQGPFPDSLIANSAWVKDSRNSKGEFDWDSWEAGEEF